MQCGKASGPDPGSVQAPSQPETRNWKQSGHLLGPGTVLWILHWNGMGIYNEMYPPLYLLLPPHPATSYIEIGFMEIKK